MAELKKGSADNAISSHSSPPLISFKDISVRLGDRRILCHTDWEIREGQHWAVLGPNGAGKSSLVRALAGELPIVRGKVRRFLPAGAVSYISFELQRRMIAREEELDHARYFSGNLNSLTTARQIICPEDPESPPVTQIAERLGIPFLPDRPIRFLSTGEMRKVLMARALIRIPRLLILDEPFDGLDADSRRDLRKTLRCLIKENMQIILLTHREAEILPEISHVLCIRNCRVTLRGPRAEILKQAVTASRSEKKHSRLPFSIHKKSVPSSLPASPAAPLIEMKNLAVRYGNKTVFENLNWTVRPGENWAVSGPNGAGKTSLLRMISGDSLQAYANEIYLFGKRRGSGESIWEIKKHIGLVSSEFQIRYRKSLTAFDAVLSGFFDSVGLYRGADAMQKEKAKQQMAEMGIEDKSERLFDRLSCGEQRMVLLARAMVKSPALLILDEPCQGLDAGNREMILTWADYIGRHSDTRILYVSHYPDEIPACIGHILHLEKEKYRIEHK
ncbi:MAG: ATP-binding cassette domain-containing protein [Desulfococcaceae bacterium]|jgi:molybdate transport system ATP-binding protein|nr:ATP-binding cassette domain-containing protein [Desulfococcaceae bacterium]